MFLTCNLQAVIHLIQKQFIFEKKSKWIITNNAMKMIKPKKKSWAPKLIENSFILFSVFSDKI